MKFKIDVTYLLKISSLNTRIFNLTEISKAIKVGRITLKTSDIEVCSIYIKNIYIYSNTRMTMKQPECIGLSLVVPCSELGKETKHEGQSGAGEVLSSSFTCTHR